MTKISKLGTKSFIKLAQILWGLSHVRTIRDTILSEPWLHANIFRGQCYKTFYGRK
jgi:hypothetical protein